MIHSVYKHDRNYIKHATNYINNDRNYIRLALENHRQAKLTAFLFSASAPSLTASSAFQPALCWHAEESREELGAEDDG